MTLSVPAQLLQLGFLVKVTYGENTRKLNWEVFKVLLALSFTFLHLHLSGPDSFMPHWESPKYEGPTR